MPRFPLALPSGETLADEFARDLVSLLGWPAPDGSNHADDARAMGTATGLAHTRLGEAASEGFTPRANELLDEWETILGAVASTGSSTTARRAALTGIRRSSGANSSRPFLAALQAIDPTASYATGSVLENLTYPRGVFVFSVRLAPAVLADSVQLARVVDVLERMKPAHTTYTLASREVARSRSEPRVGQRR
jgi:hypothetical protein